MPLRALALNCTLKPSPEASSTDRMIGVVADALAAHDITTETIRVVDHDVRPGVESDEGSGDEWPAIRQQIVDADILVLATPIWLGTPSSVAKQVVERLDAFLGETDDRGRMPAYSKVAVAAVVGNEDGAHRSAADLYQWLGDVGFTIPANAVVYWVGEAMGSTDFGDLEEVPDKTRSTAEQTASNAAHLARLLAESPYPGVAGD
jgi:multimeric flavodoxin WrbA